MIALSSNPDYLVLCLQKKIVVHSNLFLFGVIWSGQVLTLIEFPRSGDYVQ